MSAIWVILIDISGSMRGGFSQNENTSGLIVEKGAYQTKIEAAKDILLKQIKGIPNSEVAVIAFNHQPYLVHRNLSTDTQGFEKPITELQAGGGTDISAALLFALQLENIQQYRPVSFLLITDGWSDGDPVSAAQKCADTFGGYLQISTILIGESPNGLDTAKAISINGQVRIVESSMKFDEAVREERISHEAAVAAVIPPNIEAIREWWHEILRNYGKYSCYAFFLMLPSDREAIKYLTYYGKEIDIISAKNCLVIALSKNEFKRVGFDKHIWEYAVNEQSNEGYSLAIANKFKIKLTEFPCIVLFDNIRKPKKVIFSLKDKTSDDISKQVRTIFSEINDSVEKKISPITALERYQGTEKLNKVRQSFWSKLFAFTEKTFEFATEAWINMLIK